MDKIVWIDDIQMGKNHPLVLIAGPCVIENEATAFDIARQLKEITGALNIPFIFKASYDKANRTSINAFRGPGITEGLAILAKIKNELGLKILSDVHGIEEIAPAAEVLDVLQVPAFLCRQTDLIVEIAKTGKPVNIKKGQFLAPWDVSNIILKIESTGNRNILLTERGAMFGYNNLVVDFRSIPIMQATGYPVIFDATHSIQLPGGNGTSSGGQREFAAVLAKAAVACGADGIFMEVHTDPDKALCDGPNALSMDAVKPLLKTLTAIKTAVTPMVVQKG
jgi:2-dehydro-3-deoxyphosphooctonate aldolase (KDO 8-P synthase)